MQGILVWIPPLAINVALGQSLASQLTAAPRLRLRDGSHMPSIALGTSLLEGERGVEAIKFALQSGYRSLDSALSYRNHEAVSHGITLSGVPREEIFLISKVPPNMHGYIKGAEAVSRMLSELNTPYVDLCLVHYPGLGWPWEAHKKEPDAKIVIERAGTSRALEDAHRRGQCRHIGVSNYFPNHLDELLDYAEIPPAVNQIEYHPYNVDHDTIQYCRRYRIAVQAYGSINAAGLLDDPVVAALAFEMGRSKGQVLLRWALQQGVMVLPKSGSKERIIENARLWDFSLTEDQQLRLSRLDRKSRTYLHPQYVPIGKFRSKRAWHSWRVTNHSMLKG